MHKQGCMCVSGHQLGRDSLASRQGHRLHCMPPPHPYLQAGEAVVQSGTHSLEIDCHPASQTASIVVCEGKGCLCQGNALTYCVVSCDYSCLSFCLSVCVAHTVRSCPVHATPTPHKDEWHCACMLCVKMLAAPDWYTCVSCDSVGRVIMPCFQCVFKAGAASVAALIYTEGCLGVPGMCRVLLVQSQAVLVLVISK